VSILEFPSSIRALVFDVDGVLLDTLGADYDLCIAAAKNVLGDAGWLKRESVRKFFPLESESFWRELIKDRPSPTSDAEFIALIKSYESGRAAGVFKVLAGAEDAIAQAASAGLKIAIASSNDDAVLRNMLTHAGLINRFEAISGLGGPDISPKPAPDLYINAARMIGASPSECAFIEDSITGLKAGRAAGYGYAFAVATGAATFDALVQSGLADRVYDRLAAPSLRFIDTQPTNKRIDTPNDFVSHMIEHIGWRIGAGVELSWRNNDWRGLGKLIGEGIRALGVSSGSAATLGMIDDGAAEVMIDLDAPASATFETHPSLPRAQVLAMRVEQVAAGAMLVEMMQGLAEGLEGRIVARMCTFEDPHHSWEGVYRAIGICLARLRAQSARSAA